MSRCFVERLSQEESERFRRWIHVAKRRLGVTFRLVAAGTGVARNSLLFYANQPGRRVPREVARRVHGFFEELAVLTGRKKGEL